MEYSVYVHRTPNDLYYVGMTNNAYNRFMGSYKGTAFQPYIDEFGWDKIETKIIKDGLDYDKAVEFEDLLITTYQSFGKCINIRHSGNVSKDIKQYQKEYYEKRNKRNQEKYKTTEWKIYNRVNAFNRKHNDKMVETALEAKRKYLESGYIPNYVKNNDL